MKKNFLYAMMSAIALTGAVCVSSCSSSDEVADVNPTYDGESVKTTFTISIGDVKSPTRMAATAVQADEAFQGMTDIYLFPFTETVAANKTINESYIHLADFAEFNSSVEKAQGKIYNDVNLSVGVSDFLFYGAIKSTSQGNGQLKPSYLSLTDNNWATGSTTWAPVPINKGASKVGVYDYATDPAHPAINGITFDLVPIRRGWVLADVKANDDAKATIKPLNDADAALTAAIGGITGTTAAETAAKNKLTEIQKTLRNELEAGTFTAYAGSSNSIKSLMEMLYATLKNLAGSTLKSGEGTSYGDDVMTAIEGSFTATADQTTGEWTLAWVSDPGFPANLGVPDGAAAVKYVDEDLTDDNDGDFEFVSTSVEGLAVPAISNYTYPARLYYTVNTKSMVKDAEYLSTNDNTTNDTWAKVKTAGGYTQGPVAATTRSVIMKDQVQYAVGRLDVNVRVKPETIINDNSKEAEQPVTVPTGGYELTGVLIGGQKQVGWDFTPIDGAPEMTIWDNIMTSTIKATQGSDFAGPNRTLALETKANTSINIALEFVNTGNDFCGVDHNVIPAGTKFYLVAQLDPNSNTTYKEQDPENTTNDPDDTWNATDNVIKQVIKQDYVTIVNLTIGANSLKKAYNVVPDLRSPKLEFGLSVDLHWRTGITFDVEL